MLWNIFTLTIKKDLVEPSIVIIPYIWGWKFLYTHQHTQTIWHANHGQKDTKVLHPTICGTGHLVLSKMACIIQTDERHRYKRQKNMENDKFPRSGSRGQTLKLNPDDRHPRSARNRKVEVCKESLKRSLNRWYLVFFRK